MKTLLKPSFKGIIIFFIFAAAAASIVYISVKASSSPPPAPLSQEEEDEFFDKITELLSSQPTIDDAVELLEKTIRENPGTSLEALCRIELAGIYGFMKRDGEKMVQEYETVAREFNGTVYGFYAQSLLINSHYKKKDVPFEVWLDKNDELLIESGGISVYDIINAKNMDNDEWRQIIKEGRFKYGNDVLAERYYILGCSFSRDRPHDEIKIYQFVRLYFPEYERGRENVKKLTDVLCAIKGVSLYSEHAIDESPPVIRAIAPRAGLTIGDKRPKIEVELHDGDVFQGQVRLDTLIFTLNGKDLTEDMEMRINYNNSCKPKVVFEKIRLVYKPKENLPPGQYTVYIKAEDRYKQSSEESWSFNIK